jgi:hypothetical protein
MKVVVEGVAFPAVSKRREAGAKRAPPAGGANGRKWIRMALAYWLHGLISRPDVGVQSEC